MIRLGNLVLGGIDIPAGDFTYGNRIALGQIFADESTSAYKRLCAAFRELYGYPARLLPLKRRVRVLTALSRGVAEWIEKEQQLLTYEPSQDEKAAGLEEYAHRVGDISTPNAIAGKFGLDPDTVLRWPYAKVFGILWADLEGAKYERKLNKVINERYTKHTRRFH